MNKESKFRMLSCWSKLQISKGRTMKSKSSKIFSTESTRFLSTATSSMLRRTKFQPIQSSYSHNLGNCLNLYSCSPVTSKSGLREFQIAKQQRDSWRKSSRKEEFRKKRREKKPKGKLCRQEKNTMSLPNSKIHKFLSYKK